MVFDANKFNIYDFWVRISWTLSCSSFYPFRFGETFYVHLVGPDNKVIISLPLTLVNWESYDLNQVISCYFTLLPHIKKYLDYSDFSDLDGDYRPIVLYIGTTRVDSLNKVGDYLQDADDIDYEIKEHEIQADFVSDIIEGDKTLINDLKDVSEDFCDLDDDLEIIEAEIEDAETTLKQLKDQIEERCCLLRSLKEVQVYFKNLY